MKLFQKMNLKNIWLNNLIVSFFNGLFGRLPWDYWGRKKKDVMLVTNLLKVLMNAGNIWKKYILQLNPVRDVLDWCNGKDNMLNNLPWILSTCVENVILLVKCGVIIQTRLDFFIFWYYLYLCMQPKLLTFGCNSTQRQVYCHNIRLEKRNIKLKT